MLVCDELKICGGIGGGLFEIFVPPFVPKG